MAPLPPFMTEINRPSLTGFRDSSVEPLTNGSVYVMVCNLTNPLEYDTLEVRTEPRGFITQMDNFFGRGFHKGEYNEEHYVVYI